MDQAKALQASEHQKPGIKLLPDAHSEFPVAISSPSLPVAAGLVAAIVLLLVLWAKRPFPRRRPERSLDEELAEWRIVSITNAPERERSVLRLRLVRPTTAGTTFATAIKISWKYPGDMPADDTNATHLAFERAIDQLTGDNNFAELVQVATGGGVKEWLFYCSDQERFTKEFHRLLAGHEAYPLEISSVDDPEWSIWRESVEAVQRATTSQPVH